MGIYTLDGDRKKGRSLLRRARRRAGVLRERVVLAADEAAGLGRVRRDPGAVLLVVALLVPFAGVRACRAAGGRAAVPGADVILALDVAARGPLGHPRAVFRGLVLLVPRQIVRTRYEDLVERMDDAVRGEDVRDNDVRVVDPHGVEAHENLASLERLGLHVVREIGAQGLRAEDVV